MDELFEVLIREQKAEEFQISKEPNEMPSTKKQVSERCGGRVGEICEILIKEEPRQQEVEEIDPEPDDSTRTEAFCKSIEITDLITSATLESDAIKSCHTNNTQVTSGKSHKSKRRKKKGYLSQLKAKREYARIRHEKIRNSKPRHERESKHKRKRKLNLTEAENTSTSEPNQTSTDAKIDDDLKSFLVEDVRTREEINAERRLKHKMQRSMETEEQREARKKRQRESARSRRSKESDEHRESRRKADRERAKRRRDEKRLEKFFGKILKKPNKVQSKKVEADLNCN